MTRRRLTLEWLERRDVPSFAAPQAILAGASPSDVTNDDFNGDGHYDIAVVNNTAPGTVSVMLGAGGGKFGAPKSYPTGGNYPTSLVAVDVTGDGRLDLVATNYVYKNDATIAVLRGSGTGLFRRPITFPAGQNPFGVGYADFNFDAVTDLVVANVDEGVTVLFGGVGGTFNQKVSFDVGTKVKAVSTGDFNSDGVSDVVAVGYHNTAPKTAILLSNADGTFTFGPQYNDGLPIDVSVADYNADFKLDLAVASVGNNIFFRLGNGDGTFALHGVQPTNAGLKSIETEDINADGQLDILALNLSEEFTVYLGQGDGNFVPGVPYVGGPAAVAAAIRDFTGDGIPDVVVANKVTGAGTVTLQVGQGNGTFQQGLPVSLPVSTQGMMSLDVNGDADADLASAYDLELDLYVGAAGAGYEFHSSYPFFGAYYGEADMVSADVNNDGILDLSLNSNSSPYFNVLMGSSGGGFVTAPLLPAGIRPGDVAVADFDLDANLDAVVVSNDFDLSVMFGNGDGNFTSPSSFGAGVSPQDVAVGDFNGDAIPDIAVSNHESAGAITVLFSNGDGTFQSPASFAVGSFPRRIEVADLNGDGLLDIATVNYSSGTVSVLLGNGNGTFKPHISSTTGPGPEALNVGDLNGDTIFDVVVIDHLGKKLSVLLGNGDGSFQPPTVVLSLMYPITDVEVGDFDENGSPDLAVAQYGPILILLNNGDATFQPPQTAASNGSSKQMSVRDFNADGHLDIATANPTWIAVGLGNGNGAFQNHTIYSAGLQPLEDLYFVELAPGDFNNDGTLDVVVTNRDGDSLGVFVSNGNRFAALAAYYIPGYTRDMVPGDFNEDGALDFAVISDAGVNVTLGNGDGSFKPALSFPAGPSPLGLVAADFNGDGHLDLATANQGSSPTFAGSTSVLLGNGDGTFQSTVTLTAGISSYDLITEDLNSDGSLDLVVVNRGSGESYSVKAGTVSVFIGNGDGTFAAQVEYPVGASPEYLTAGDMNNDGVIDVAVTNLKGDTLTLLLGIGDGTFQFAVHFLVGDEPREIVITDPNQDGWLDLVFARKDGIAILANDGIWPPMPIGDGPRPNASLSTGHRAETSPPATVDPQVLRDTSVSLADASDTVIAPLPKHVGRRIVRVAAAPVDDPFLVDLT